MGPSGFLPGDPWHLPEVAVEAEDSEILLPLRMGHAKAIDEVQGRVVCVYVEGARLAGLRGVALSTREYRSKLTRVVE